MNKYFAIPILLYVIFIPTIKSSEITAKGQNDEEIREIVSKLKNPDWKLRAQIIYSIDTLNLKNQMIQKAFVNLLIKENEFLKELGHFPGIDENYDENYSEVYYKYLIETVAEFKRNENIPIVLETMNIFSTRKIVEIVSEMGEPAAKYLIEILKDERKRVSATVYLRAIVLRDNDYPETISDSTRELIKKEIIEFLRYDKQSIRRSAVRLLGQYREPEVKLILQKISETDPHFIIKDVNGRREKVYPIRELAKKQLQLMKENE